MSMTKRLAIRLLERMGGRTWGLEPHVLALLVDGLGTASAVWWCASVLPRYRAAQERFGAVRSHLLCVGICLLRGDSHGMAEHTRTFQRLFLGRAGRPCPLGERDFASLTGLDGLAFRVRAEALLRQAGLSEEIELFERMVALVTGEAIGEQPEDDDVQSLVEVLAVIDACRVRARTRARAAHHRSLAPNDGLAVGHGAG